MSRVKEKNFNLKFDVPRHDLKIIIADRSEELLRVYEKAFEVAGIKVVAKFTRGEDLLMHFASSQKNASNSVVVLLDHKMREMSSFEISRRLKEINPAQRIILSTTEELSHFISEDSLIDGVIRKPFTISELVETIQKALSPIRVRGSKILSDPEEIEELIREITADSKTEMCSVRMASSLPLVRKYKEHVPTYVAAHTKKLEVRIITEITNENLYYCKEMMVNQGVKLRHLSGLVNNFSVWDGKHSAESIVSSNYDDSYKLGVVFYSNLDDIVARNQSIFEKLWSMSKPGEYMIRELETNIISSSDVRVIFGLEEIMKVRAQMIRDTRRSLDVCSFSDWFKIVIPKLKEVYVEVVSRGVQCRFIVEITEENIGMVKEMEEIGVQIRSLSDLKAAFSTNEKEFIGVSSAKDFRKEDEVTNIYSTLPGFVKQHQSIFDVLWRVAIPSSQRKKEIEQSQRTNVQ